MKTYHPQALTGAVDHQRQHIFQGEGAGANAFAAFGSQALRSEGRPENQSRSTHPQREGGLLPVGSADQEPQARRQRWRWCRAQRWRRRSCRRNRCEARDQAGCCDGRKATRARCSHKRQAQTHHLSHAQASLAERGQTTKAEGVNPQPFDPKPSEAVTEQIKAAQSTGRQTLLLFGFERAPLAAMNRTRFQSDS